MAEVVFVLGAGASAGSGAPLMTNFLDVAEDLWLRGGAKDAAPHFERVFRSIAALKSVHAQVALDTYNLESVFSAFEMGAMIGRLGRIDDPEVIKATRDAMVWVIARTLEEKLRLPVSERRVHPPWDYGYFVELLRRVRDPQRGARSAAVITLNYDLGLDYALHSSGMAPAYFVSEKDADAPAPGGGLPLLKLHGSLNWGTCFACGKLAAWDLRTFFQDHNWNILFPEDETTVVLDISRHLPSMPHCTSNLRPEPVVVPPTWNKSDNQLLRGVWRRAAHELSEARYLVFAGYSFPETDLYFQYLLSLGLAGDTRIRRIGVLNPDRSAFEKLNHVLTPTLRSRASFVEGRFDQAGIAKLDGVLELRDGR